MAVKQVDSSLALAIAASVDFPELPSQGTHVEYGGKRYLLAVRNGVYIAFDITVYDSQGRATNSEFDVYWDALKDGLGEGLTDFAKYLKWILILVALVFAISLVGKLRV